MHLCYSILALVGAHFQATEEVILPYLDKAFDGPRFEKEVLTPLRGADHEALRAVASPGNGPQELLSRP